MSSRAPFATQCRDEFRSTQGRVFLDEMKNITESDLNVYSIKIAAVAQVGMPD